MLLLLNYIIKVLICQYFLSLLYAKIPAISHWNFCFRVPILGHPLIPAVSILSAVLVSYHNGYLN